jgi:CheY-like chemotaxis protein
MAENIPVIAMTARASAQDIEQGLDAGFGHYSTKPIDAEEITNTAKGYLGPPAAMVAEDTSRPQGNL